MAKKRLFGICFVEISTKKASALYSHRLTKMTVVFVDRPAGP